MRLRLCIQMHHVTHRTQLRRNVTLTFFVALMCHVEDEGLRCGSPFFVEPWMAAVPESVSHVNRSMAWQHNVIDV